jgi:MFS family permease
VQGFSAGGEFGSASAVLIEFAPAGRSGFYGSFQIVSQWLAFAVGAAMGIGLNLSLSADAYTGWGWRIPFILGILIGPTGWYLRQRCDESPEFQACLAEKAATPHLARQTTLGELFSEYPRELIAGFCVTAAATATSYVSIVFLSAYAVAELKLPALNVQMGLLCMCLANVRVSVACGALSDRIGRRTMVVFGLITYSVLSSVGGLPMAIQLMGHNTAPTRGLLPSPIG